MTKLHLPSEASAKMSLSPILLSDNHLTYIRMQGSQAVVTSQALCVNGNCITTVLLLMLALLDTILRLHN